MKKKILQTSKEFFRGKWQTINVYDDGSVKPVSEAATIGSKGGRANVKKHGKKHMQKIGRAGAVKRWKDHDVSTK